MTKSWLGSGTWHLPGGGLHLGEDPPEGACRELFEETGINVNQDQLIYMYTKWTRAERGFRFRYFAYYLELKKKPKLKSQQGEVTDIAWLSMEKIAKEHKRGTVTDMLAHWKKS